MFHSQRSGFAFGVNKGHSYDNPEVAGSSPALVSFYVFIVKMIYVPSQFPL